MKKLKFSFIAGLFALASLAAMSVTRSAGADDWGPEAYGGCRCGRP